MKLLEQQQSDFIRFYIPSTIPSSVLHPKYKKSSKVKYLVHLVNRLWHNRKDWTPLSSRFLTSVLGRKYRSYIDYLKENDVLEVNESYSTAQNYCKTYRLTKPHRFARTQLHRCSDSSLIRRLSKRLKEENEKFYREQPFIHLRESLEATDINFDKACRFVFSSEKYTSSHKNSYYKIIKKIDSGSVRYSIADSNNRLHTPITNLHSQLRNFLSIDGDSDLVNLDITNSQPFFFALMISQNTKHITHNYATSPPEEGEDTNVSYPLSNSQFVKDAVEGRLYEEVAEIFDTDRDGGKEKIFEILFSHPNAHLKKKKRFEERYPKALEIALKEKRYGHDHKRLAFRMQRLESDVMLNDFCSRLQEAGIKILTIHDSVICKRSKLDTTRRLFEKTFEERFGVVPDIHKESLEADYEASRMTQDDIQNMTEDLNEL